MSGKGALTKEDLLEVWLASVDKGYSEPFTMAGEGEGLEIHTQAMHQLARISEAINTTTQAMYLRPYSGQTGAPAQGENKATVLIKISRSSATSRSVTLKAGIFAVEEYQEDWGENGPELVRTGRKYIINSDVVFLPLESGTKEVLATAEKPGWGYNNPLPGKLRWLTQPGDGLDNSNATLSYPNGYLPTMSFTGAFPVNFANPVVVPRLTAKGTPDMFIPELVGQYIMFTAGINAGKIAQIAAYVTPTVGAEYYTAGSAVDLKMVSVVVLDPSLGTGELRTGEYVFAQSGAQKMVGFIEHASYTGSGTGTLTISYVEGNPAALSTTPTLTGFTTSATGVPTLLAVDGLLATEGPNISGVGGASWRVMKWGDDFGLSSTNDQKPAGGRLGFLDLLGHERGVSRAQGEPDEAYRSRIINVGDVVTPNAINRAIVRAIGQIPYCYSEPGDDNFPGCFYDGDLVAPSVTPRSSKNDFYDFDTQQFNVPLSNAFAITSLNSSISNNLMRMHLVDNATGHTLATGWYGGSKTLGSSIALYITYDQNPNIGYVPGQTFTVKFFRTNESGPAALTITPATFETQNQETAVIPFLNRFMLSKEQFRGFMFICLPHLSFGEFGMFYDEGNGGFMDDGPNGYMDGYPAQVSAIVKRLFASIDDTKAGGVGYEVCINDDCV